MKNQLKIITAGLGLAVGGLSLFSVSASAMSASGVAAISKVNHVSDAVGLPVEHVQYYPYGFPCVFPFPCGYGYYGGGYYGRGFGGRGHYGRGFGGHGGGGHGARHPLQPRLKPQAGRHSDATKVSPGT